ncbi:unnamed protein product [Penicillium nalgiovense]|uniref:Uncharacterized protein n=1 Tax=Penicillium nalgiovense TaxID=60175 RepID=A0A9W4HUU2_PENNA|nr:unnamed protein product [Penicillium nalgiovense]CAG7965956.1 unnamed protein product [Penicillium nalgiovense]CAG8045506.1 unnamed protein product [Penicillium nalgiovense]CAG8065344.1 unnamed protein product [Penicillium nalgiovense]CAG8074071.1 unnamed protein product [Penicillium nalgiovense]
MTNLTPSIPSRLLQLPAELRLKIYEYALDVPNEYLVSKPMIVLGDHGNTFTSRGQYRALSMSPHWVGEDGTARKLLAVNRQLHDEAEDFLYSTHTLFLRNSFNLDRLGDFLDTLSATARARIRSVGFEVFFFVHTQTGVPKRTLKQYETAARLLSEKLPRWNSVLLYLDPRYYYPSANVGGRDLTARGVFDLATRFGALCKDVSFYPLPNGDQHLIDEAQQFVWRSRSPLRQDGRRSIKGCSAWSLDFKKTLVPSRLRSASGANSGHTFTDILRSLIYNYTHRWPRGFVPYWDPRMKLRALSSLTASRNSTGQRGKGFAGWARLRLPYGHGSLYKEVRFSPTETPIRRTKSVSATFPPVISGYGRTAFQDSALVNSFAMDTSYIDQSRALLQCQRVNLERERDLFAQERQLWEKERTLLRSKIAELEELVKGQGGGTNQLGSEAAKLVLAGGMSQYNTNRFAAQVWEGTSPDSRPTRVFSDHESPDRSYLSPISESGNPPSLDRALSPQSRQVDPSAAPSQPVPIEKLDSTLDGITLKSTALPPSVVARVITPPSPSPLVTPPDTAPSAAARHPVEHRNSFKLKLSELGPPNENLLRHAGHTPMAIIDVDDSRRSTQEGTPLEVGPQAEEAPFAPVATNVHQPSENEISYFPDVPEDPALQGPLGLINDEEHDSNFLNELDQKLLDQAKNILGSSVESTDPNEADPESGFPREEEEPEIKFRKSTNFGTAFGISNSSHV